VTGEQLTQQERIAVARLHALLELLPSALDKELAPTGLTSFEFTLLQALAEAAGNRLRLSALASRTNASLPRLSRVVTGLERKGLVMRVACEQDGRATNAVLTDAGARAYRDGGPRFTEALRTMVLSALGEDGVAQLSDISLAILARLDPERRFDVTACPADPQPVDPAPASTAH
jgi:DNA-binding MarR family transcriptional regulator